MLPWEYDVTLSEILLAIINFQSMIIGLMLTSGKVILVMLENRNDSVYPWLYGLSYSVIKANHAASFREESLQ